jgi:hypothetical protein
LLALFDSENPAKLIESSGQLPTLQLKYSPVHAVTNAFSATFSSAPPASPDPHISNIPISVLLEHALPELYSSSQSDIGGTAQTWKASDLSSFPASEKPKSAAQTNLSTYLNKEDAYARPSRIDWSTLISPGAIQDEAKFALVDGLMKDGIAFVTGLPTDKTGNSVDASADDSPSLARLAEMVR